MTSPGTSATIPLTVATDVFTVKTDAFRVTRASSTKATDEYMSTTRSVRSHPTRVKAVSNSVSDLLTTTVVPLASESTENTQSQTSFSLAHTIKNPTTDAKVSPSTSATGSHDSSTGTRHSTAKHPDNVSEDTYTASTPLKSPSSQSSVSQKQPSTKSLTKDTTAISTTAAKSTVAKEHSKAASKQFTPTTFKSTLTSAFADRTITLGPESTERSSNAVVTNKTVAFSKTTTASRVPNKSAERDDFTPDTTQSTYTTTTSSFLATADKQSQKPPTTNMNNVMSPKTAITTIPSTTTTDSVIMKTETFPLTYASSTTATDKYLSPRTSTTVASTAAADVVTVKTDTFPVTRASSTAATDEHLSQTRSVQSLPTSVKVASNSVSDSTTKVSSTVPVASESTKHSQSQTGFTSSQAHTTKDSTTDAAVLPTSSHDGSSETGHSTVKRPDNISSDRFISSTTTTSPTSRSPTSQNQTSTKSFTADASAISTIVENDVTTATSRLSSSIRSETTSTTQFVVGKVTSGDNGNVPETTRPTHTQTAASYPATDSGRITARPSWVTTTTAAAQSTVPKQRTTSTSKPFSPTKYKSTVTSAFADTPTTRSPESTQRSADAVVTTGETVISPETTTPSTVTYISTETTPLSTRDGTKSTSRTSATSLLATTNKQSREMSATKMDNTMPPRTSTTIPLTSTTDASQIKTDPVPVTSSVFARTTNSSTVRKDESLSPGDTSSKATSVKSSTSLQKTAASVSVIATRSTTATDEFLSTTRTAKSHETSSKFVSNGVSDLTTTVTSVVDPLRTNSDFSSTSGFSLTSQANWSASKAVSEITESQRTDATAVASAETATVRVVLKTAGANVSSVTTLPVKAVSTKSTASATAQRQSASDGPASPSTSGSLLSISSSFHRSDTSTQSTLSRADTASSSHVPTQPHTSTHQTGRVSASDLSLAATNQSAVTTSLDATTTLFAATSDDKITTKETFPVTYRYSTTATDEYLSTTRSVQSRPTSVKAVSNSDSDLTRTVISTVVLASESTKISQSQTSFSRVHTTKDDSTTSVTTSSSDTATRQHTRHVYTTDLPPTATNPPVTRRPSTTATDKNSSTTRSVHSHPTSVKAVSNSVSDLLTTTVSSTVPLASKSTENTQSQTSLNRAHTIKNPTTDAKVLPTSSAAGSHDSSTGTRYSTTKSPDVTSTDTYTAITLLKSPSSQSSTSQNQPSSKSLTTDTVSILYTVADVTTATTQLPSSVRSKTSFTTQAILKNVSSSDKGHVLQTTQHFQTATLYPVTRTTGDVAMKSTTKPQTTFATDDLSRPPSTSQHLTTTVLSPTSKVTLNNATSSVRTVSSLATVGLGKQSRAMPTTSSEQYSPDTSSTTENYTAMTSSTTTQVDNAMSPKTAMTVPSTNTSSVIDAGRTSASDTATRQRTRHVSTTDLPPTATYPPVTYWSLTPATGEYLSTTRSVQSHPTSVKAVSNSVSDLLTTTVVPLASESTENTQSQTSFSLAHAIKNPTTDAKVSSSTSTAGSLDRSTGTRHSTAKHPDNVSEDTYTASTALKSLSSRSSASQNQPSTKSLTTDTTTVSATAAKSTVAREHSTAASKQFTRKMPDVTYVPSAPSTSPGSQSAAATETQRVSSQALNVSSVHAYTAFTLLPTTVTSDDIGTTGYVSLEGTHRAVSSTTTQPVVSQQHKSPDVSFSTGNTAPAFTTYAVPSSKPTASTDTASVSTYSVPQSRTLSDSSELITRKTTERHLSTHVNKNSTLNYITKQSTSSSSSEVSSSREHLATPKTVSPDTETTQINITATSASASALSTGVSDVVTTGAVYKATTNSKGPISDSVAPSVETIRFSNSTVSSLFARTTESSTVSEDESSSPAASSKAASVESSTSFPMTEASLGNYTTQLTTVTDAGTKTDSVLSTMFTTAMKSTTAEFTVSTNSNGFSNTSGYSLTTPATPNATTTVSDITAHRLTDPTVASSVAVTTVPDGLRTADEVTSTDWTTSPVESAETQSRTSATVVTVPRQSASEGPVSSSTSGYFLSISSTSHGSDTSSQSTVADTDTTLSFDTVTRQHTGDVSTPNVPLSTTTNPSDVTTSFDVTTTLFAVISDDETTAETFAVTHASSEMTTNKYLPTTTSDHSSTTRLKAVSHSVSDWATTVTSDDPLTKNTQSETEFSPAHTTEDTATSAAVLPATSTTRLFESSTAAQHSTEQSPDITSEDAYIASSSSTFPTSQSVTSENQPSSEFLTTDMAEISTTVEEDVTTAITHLSSSVRSETSFATQTAPEKVTSGDEDDGLETTEHSQTATSYPVAETTGDVAVKSTTKRRTIFTTNDLPTIPSTSQHPTTKAASPTSDILLSDSTDALSTVASVTTSAIEDQSTAVSDAAATSSKQYSLDMPSTAVTSSTLYGGATETQRLSSPPFNASPEDTSSVSAVLATTDSSVDISSTEYVTDSVSLDNTYRTLSSTTSQPTVSQQHLSSDTSFPAVETTTSATHESEYTASTDTASVTSYSMPQSHTLSDSGELTTTTERDSSAYTNETSTMNYITEQRSSSSEVFSSRQHLTTPTTVSPATESTQINTTTVSPLTPSSLSTNVSDVVTTGVVNAVTTTSKEPVSHTITPSVETGISNNSTASSVVTRTVSVTEDKSASPTASSTVTGVESSTSFQKTEISAVDDTTRLRTATGAPATTDSVLRTMATGATESTTAEFTVITNLHFSTTSGYSLTTPASRNATKADHETSTPRTADTTAGTTSAETATAQGRLKTADEITSRDRTTSLPVESSASKSSTGVTVPRQSASKGTASPSTSGHVSSANSTSHGSVAVTQSIVSRTDAASSSDKVTRQRTRRVSTTDLPPSASSRSTVIAPHSAGTSGDRMTTKETFPTTFASSAAATDNHSPTTRNYRSNPTRSSVKYASSQSSSSATVPWQSASYGPATLSTSGSLHSINSTLQTSGAITQSTVMDTDTASLSGMVTLQRTRRASITDFPASATNLPAVTTSVDMTMKFTTAEFATSTSSDFRSTSANRSATPANQNASKAASEMTESQAVTGATGTTLSETATVPGVFRTVDKNLSSVTTLPVKSAATKSSPSATVQHQSASEGTASPSTSVSQFSVSSTSRRPAAVTQSTLGRTGTASSSDPVAWHQTRRVSPTDLPPTTTNPSAATSVVAGTSGDKTTDTPPVTHASSEMATDEHLLTTRSVQSHPTSVTATLAVEAVSTESTASATAQRQSASDGPASPSTSGFLLSTSSTSHRSDIPPHSTLSSTDTALSYDTVTRKHTGRVSTTDFPLSATAEPHTKSVRTAYTSRRLEYDSTETTSTSRTTKYSSETQSSPAVQTASTSADRTPGKHATHFV